MAKKDIDFFQFFKILLKLLTFSKIIPIKNDSNSQKIMIIFHAPKKS